MDKLMKDLLKEPATTVPIRAAASLSYSSSGASQLMVDEPMAPTGTSSSFSTAVVSPTSAWRSVSWVTRTVTPDERSVTWTVPQAQRVTRMALLAASSVCWPQGLDGGIGRDPITLCRTIPRRARVYAGWPTGWPTGCIPARRLVAQDRARRLP